MLRTLLTSLTFILLSFTSPSSYLRTTKATPAATADAMRNSFAEKQMAFDDHAITIYNDADLKKAGLSFEVFQKAFIGYQNIKQRHLVSPSKSILTVIDFTKPSRVKRLWIVDLKSKKLLYNTLVAHGRNTGQDKALKFSNKPNSYMSSIGFYVTDKTYFGKHGLSLRLNGMDGKYNSNAMERAIVVHGADYVSDSFVKQYGRLGRSLGCPAVPQEVSKQVINAIKDNTCLFINGADKNYQSNYLDEVHAVEAFALSTHTPVQHS